MFSLFKKGQSGPIEFSFKSRVERFWEWYSQVAGRFYLTIESGKCADLAAEVGESVDQLSPGFAWVFGPGEGGVGHSLTLSGEGVLHHQLLAIYCVSRAPKLNGWTFYGSRQPGSIEGICMKIDGHTFDPMEFWITPKIHDESQKVDITVWHPLFNRLGEEDRLRPLFLFLDEVLGEFGTGQWIGEIELNDRCLANAIPLKELHAFLRKLEADTGWKKLPPGEEATLYSSEHPHNRFLRGDVIVGTTMHPQLVGEYLSAEGRLEDPLAGTGADYVFVSIDAKVLPQGKETDARAMIEDVLDQALRTSLSGQLLGGALGSQYAYIDLLLYDGKRSLEIAQRVLREQSLPHGTAINYFAKEKEDQRIVL